jgi:hypothetical protein
MGRVAGTSNSQESLIRQYQVIQEAMDKIHVRAIKTAGTPSDMAIQIARAVEGLGDGITCEVEWVESLPVDPSGKRRKIVSTVRKTGS